MITPQDIKGRLGELVAERFPGETLYTDRVPDKFTRPGNYLALVQCTGDAEMGSGVVELRPVFKLDTFAEVDAYGNCDQRELAGRQMALTGLLLPGYIRVGDRAPKVKKLELQTGTDYARVTVTFSLTLDRADFMEAAEAPTAEHLGIRYHNKE